MATEQKRKQYNAQDSFRWTTPKVDVVARPVDPFVNPVHQKFIKDSGAGKLAPVNMPHRPGPVAAPDGSPYRPPTANYNAVSYKNDATGPLLQFLGTVLQQGTEAYGQLQKDKAADAAAEYSRLRADGMSHQEAIKQASPDTFFGMAESIYEKSTAGADLPGIKADIDEIVKQAPASATPDDVVGKVKGYLTQRLAGMPKAYKDAILPHAVAMQDAAVATHSTRLKVYQQQETLSKQAQLFPELYKFVKQEYAGDADAYFRQHVDEMIQQNETFLGIDKLDTVKTVVNSLQDAALLDVSKHDSVDSYLGWMKVPGKDGVVPVKNPTLADMYQKAESAFVQKVDYLQRKAEKEVEVAQTKAYDGFMQELDGVMQKGETSIPGFMDRVNAQAESLGWEKRMKIERFYKELNKPNEGESSYYRDQKIASLQGNFGGLGDHETLEAKFRNGQLTWNEYKDLASDATAFSNVQFREQSASLKAQFAVAGLDDGGDMDLFGSGGGSKLNKNQRMALADFQDRYKAEIAANGGKLPSATRITELAGETVDFVKKTGKELPDVTGLAQATAGMKPDELLKRVKQDYGAEDVDTQIRIVQKVVDAQKAAKQPIGPQNKPEQEKAAPAPKKPVESKSIEEVAAQQGKYQPSSAQQWMNDNVMNEDLVEGLYRIGRLGYDPLNDGSESLVTAMLRKAGGTPDAIKAAWERIKADHARQQEIMRK